MNLDFAKHQQQLQEVHRKLVDHEEEYANAVKTHEKQGHNILVCTIVIVALVAVTALFRMMDDNVDVDLAKKQGGGIGEMTLVGYGLTSVAKYLMYAGIVALGVIIILNLRRRFYYIDPVSRDNQSYAQFVILQEEAIRKLRVEEKKLEEEARAMEQAAKQAALADDRQTFGERPEENVFSDTGVMDGVSNTDGDLVLSIEDAWDSIQEEDEYENKQE
ncbi:MAG: hypothetical protein IKS10_10115 [Lachnospiraceae bacterium]|nr:hypothetical protein [Lachnospiraceae bacterium]